MVRRRESGKYHILFLGSLKVRALSKNNVLENKGLINLKIIIASTILNGIISIIKIKLIERMNNAKLVSG